MATRRSTNPNKGITQLLVDYALPVLIDSPEKDREGMIPHHGRFIGPASWDTPIRKMPESALLTFVDPKRRPAFETKFGVISNKQRARILYLLGLANAIYTKSHNALLRTVISFEKGIGVKEGLMNQGRLRPLRELGEQLNVCVRDTLFVIWWSDIEKRFLPGLYCKNVFTALGALALAKIGRPGGLSTCQRPQCGRVFIRSRGKQDYCSPQCQAAAAMTRYRAKLNKCGISKKRKHSRRKR